MSKFNLAIVCILMCSFHLFGQEDEKTVMGVKVSGYVDAYWQTKFTDNATDVSDRSFYTEAESFALGNINVTLEKEFGDFGAVGQFGFGPRAEAANDSDYPNIQQLFIYWNATDRIKLTFGEFGTFVGYEVIDAPSNFHYSTSNLFQNGPFFHTGLKADFDLGKGFGLMLGVFNQTDRIKDVDGRHTNFGAQLSHGGENSNIYLNFIYGGAAIDTELGSAEIDRGQVDLVADTQLNKVYLALNASYQFNELDISGGDSASWWGVAGYGQYSISDLLSAGIRLEYLDDKDDWIGSWGPEGNVFSATFSVPFSKDNFKFIPEFRLDTAANDVYNGKNTQITLGGALMYSF